jgi:uncharacterized protein (DUF934 family)
MTVIVTDRGFSRDDAPAGSILPFEALWSGQDLPETALAVDFPNDRDPGDLAPWFHRIALVRITFPAMGDGRGFSIASRLRGLGYAGRLRAAGPLIADQFRAARRTGFDEVEIPDDIATRQPESAWVAASAPRPDYRARLAGRAA